jgi:hypothetical protein
VWDREGNTADEATADRWETELDLDFGSGWHTVADVDGEWLEKWGGNDGTSQHSYWVLDADGVLAWRAIDGSSENVDVIVAAIEQTQP